jgi:IS5 family transposase
MSKDKYKVCNWKQYNEGLKRRGAITIWISEELPNEWHYRGEQKKGGQFLYSDWAIEVCLVVRKVYHLPFRQTEGFMESFFAQSKMALSVPHYSVLCRRSEKLPVHIKAAKAKPITDIVVDSTGLKVYGEGEWKVRMHGWSKHRSWMKLHVALDAESQQAEAVVLTTNAVDDAGAVEELLKQVDAKINSFTGDGAYDKDKTRKLLHQRTGQQQEDILEVIVPRGGAVRDGKHRAYMGQRDDDIAMIGSLGRQQWKIATGYHQRSKAETFMFRYKVILGGRLQAREINRQKTEVRVAAKILNMMLHIAKPKSERVA